MRLRICSLPGDARLDRNSPAGQFCGYSLHPVLASSPSTGPSMDDDARRLELSPSLRQLCHPDLDPLFWVPERLGALSGWWGHVPFAHWAIRAARPRVFVEL